MKKRKISEQELITGFREKNSAVINDFYEDNFKVVLKHVLDRSGQISDAEDIMQDGIVILLKKVNNQEFKPIKRMGEYFMGICRILWLKLKTEKEGRSIVELEEYKWDSVYNTYSERSGSSQLSAVIEECFKMLSNVCQEILIMRSQNKPYEDIVEKLDLKNPVNARRKKHDCHKKILSLIKKFGYK